MSIAARLIPTDESYQLHVCYALRQLSLENTDSEGRLRGMDQLWRVLDDVKYETAYRPAWRTNESRPLLAPGADYEHRRPVWKAIVTEIDRVNPAIGDSQAEKATWLQEQLKICAVLPKYDAAVERFREEMKSIRVSLHVGDEASPEADAVLTSAFKVKAEATQKMVIDIAESLLEALDKPKRQTHSM